MSSIIFSTDNWNNILSSTKKVKIEDFIKWFNQLTPVYKFIKEKSDFKKNAKGVWSSKKIPSVVMGEEGWDKIFFVKHGVFFNAFVKELENVGFDYWSEYYKYLRLQSKKYLDGYMGVLEYVTQNDAFLESNYNEIEIDINEIVKNQNLKNEINERLIDIIKLLLSSGYKNKENLLELLSLLLDRISNQSVMYHLKNLNFKIEEQKIKGNEKIKKELKKVVMEKSLLEYSENKVIYLKQNLQELNNHYTKNNNGDISSISLMIIAFIETLKDSKLSKECHYDHMKLTTDDFEILLIPKDEKSFETIKDLLNFLITELKGAKSWEFENFKTKLEKKIMEGDITEVSKKKEKLLKF